MARFWVRTHYFFVSTTPLQRTEVRTLRRLKELSRWITKTRHSRYGFVLSAH